MSKKIKLLLQILLLILLLHLLIIAKVNIEKILRHKGGVKPTQQITQKQKGFVGENITYDIIMGKIRLGKAEFTHIENVEINDRILKVIKFETSLPRFKDTELIYSDAETMLPVTIKRSILNWFTREEITEEYNQADFSVSITKKSKGKQENLVIKKDSPIHNAILLPHYVRNVAKLEVGRILRANLPNCQYDIKLVSLENIKVPGGVFNTYHFKSIPKQIEIWISADDLRIPVKIQGANKFGYSLLLKEYSTTQKTKS